MTINVKSVVRKMRPSGEEVGKALIMSLIYTYKEQLAGRGNMKTLFTAEDLGRMVNSLNETELEVYSRYEGLNNWTLTNYAGAGAMYLQADANIQKLVGILMTAVAAESAFCAMEKTPLIMTEPQYEKFIHKQREKVFSNWPEENLFQLIANAVEYHVHMYLTHRDKCWPRMEEFYRLYTASKPTSPIIKSQFNEAAGNGYWELSDGTRSDQVKSKEEWMLASLKPRYRGRLRELLKTDSLGDSMSKLVSMLQQEENPEEMVATSRCYVVHDYFLPCQWVCELDIPENTTKWDTLTKAPLGRYYMGIYDSATTSDRDVVREIKDFRKEFPEMIDAILEQASVLLGEDLVSLPVTEWTKKTWSVRRLYEEDVYGYRKKVNMPDILFSDNMQARAAGVAVLANAGSETVINEDGNYVPVDPASKKLLGRNIGLEQYIGNDEETKKNIRELERCYHDILTGYQFVLAYDTACNMIAKYINIPDFTIFKQRSAALTDEIKKLNAMVPMLHLKITSINYANEEAKRKKIRVLMDYFKPIDTRKAVPKKKNVELAEQMLKDNMRAFYAQDGQFLSALMGGEVDET